MGFNISDISMDRFYVQNVDDLPSIYFHTLTPDQNTQQIGYIWGWVDVVGFQNTAVIEEVSYTSRSPLDTVIVRYDAKPNPPGNVESFETKLQVFQDGENITAKLNAKLEWSRVVCSGMSCYTQYYEEKAVFTDTEIPPVAFQYNGTQNLTIEQYGGIVPKNIVSFDYFDKSILDYTVSTRNGTVEHIMKIGEVRYTRKGVPFMNVTEFERWKNTGTGIYHQMDDVIMENTTEFSVLYHTPFGEADLSTNYTVTKMRQSEIESFLVPFFYVVGVFLLGIYLMHRVTS